MESKVLRENGLSNAGAANLGEELSKLLKLINLDLKFSG
jgi:hypothetical protein